MLLIQKICTTNDTNGNPRRAWMLIRALGIRGGDFTSELINFVPESYSGNYPIYRAVAIEAGVAPEQITPQGLSSRTTAKLAAWLPEIVVAPSEFRRLVADAKERKLYDLHG